MFCARCGHENPDDASFCGECGAPQEAPGEPQQQPREVGLYRPELSTGPADIPPRNLGELISETFSVYGRAIGPFFAIALIPQLPNLLSFAVGGVVEAGLSLLSVLLGLLSAGAGIFCAVQVITGRSADVAVCYARAVNVLVRIVLASIVIFLAIVGSVILMLVIVGIPLLFYLTVVWFFTLHAIILEGRGAIDSLGRSRGLVRGSWWRVFGIGVVFVLLLVSLWIPGLIVAGIIAIGSPAISLVAIGVVGALIGPIISIGSTLVYIDLRVRKEGYNLGALADDMAPKASL